MRRAGRQGTSVTDLDAETAAEMLDLRRRIELRGARRAARRAGAGEVAELRRRLDAMARAAAASALWPLIEHDMEFHLALFRLSGFHALEPILARVMLHTQRFKLWAPWHQRPLARPPRATRRSWRRCKTVIPPLWCARWARISIPSWNTAAPRERAASDGGTS